MNERELKQSLESLDLAASRDDVKQMTRKVLARDRFRTLLFTGLIIGIWQIAVVAILAALVFFGLLFPRHAHMRQQIAAGQLNQAETVQMQVSYMEDYQKAQFYVTLSLLALLVAGLGTVLLITFSRQVTLRRVNANLIEIGEELKQLRVALAKS